MSLTIEDYERWLEDAKERGDRQLERNCVGALGNMYAARGDASRALEYQERALELREDATACHNIAATYWRLLRDYQKAIHYMQRAVDLSSGKVQEDNQRWLSHILEDERADSEQTHR